MSADDRAAKLASFDFETHLFRQGLQAPPIVCASAARLIDGKIVGELLHPPDHACNHLERLLGGDGITAFANAPFDLAVSAQRRPDLLAVIFRALREGRVHDVLTARALDQIYHGTLGVDPRTGDDMRSPTTGKVTKRYSLELVHYQLTGKADAKKNDVWRKSYALLETIPVDQWPAEAVQYPIDDACNTLEDAAIQIFGEYSPHAWVSQPAIPGVIGEKTICRHCRGELTMSWPIGNAPCEATPREPHKNLENLPAQVRAGFVAWLGACHGFRTDPERVEALDKEVQKKNDEFVAHFKLKGWVRPDGSEDAAAVKRVVAAAYGACGSCSRCGGSGKVQSFKMAPCRGEKVRTRYQGCVGRQCAVCFGDGVVKKLGNEITCKNVFDEDMLKRGKSREDSLVEAGCDGTGFDLSTARYMPRSDSLGVKTNRDTLLESGDDDLSDYGADEWKKSLTTYIPYLRNGISVPLKYQPNTIVATGRYSYEESPLHQMPRKGKERGCIRARGAWCGYPIETVLSSTDYEAGELCTLAQYCHWTVGQSKMMEAINSSGSPGILHSDLAAQVLGIPLDEFLVRLKAKDKQAVEFRQAAKPYLFGRGGLMGPPKIVLTSRAKNAGFTPIVGGPAFFENEKGERVFGYHGIRFCILIDGQTKCGVDKITHWKKRACAPVCRRCVEVVDSVLGAAYNKRYPEMPEYFNWIQRCLEKYENRVPSLVWDAEAGRPRIVRWRGADSDYFRSAASNNGFQSMLGDVIKDAYYTMTEECYLGVKEDGSPSPLAGCRIPIVIHDEPIGELIRETAHLSAPRIADIMIASGKKIAPDVVWKAESAISLYWEKGMEPIYSPLNGNLMLWEPPIKKAA